MKKLGIALLMTLSACNSVKNDPLPAANDTKALAAIGERLDEKDKPLLAGYLMRREMAKAFKSELKDNATTVGQAIEAQRKWAANLSESEQQAATLKAEVEQKRRAVAEQIDRAVTVAFLNATKVESDPMSGRYGDTEEFTFAVQNRGAKPIKAVRGEAVFIDTFGDDYARVPMQFERDVAPGERKTIELSYELNQFMDDDKKISRLDKNYRFKFVPTQIVFSDGSTIRAPDAPE